MNPSHTLRLEFDPAAEQLGKGKTLRDGLSVALQIGQTLWVANDETLSLERLTLTADSVTGMLAQGGVHVSFPLAEYLDLPVPPSADPEKTVEADLEGLAYADGALWLVGSHSLKRKKPKTKDSADKAAQQLAKVSHDGNRYLLARIPMLESGGNWRLARQDGQRSAARLAGDDRGNALAKALRDDEHLAPFLDIPGKDNGFDIEGLAIADGRLFLGLRGPVLRGWAVILELEVETDADSPEILHLKAIAADERPYLKHFLQLGGLGIRDLCRHGDDLLILAGPTMDLDGPVRVLRWRDGAKRHASGEMIPNEALQWVLDIPYGQGDDHAEGMTLFSADGGKTQALLVVYDATAKQRKRGESAVAADIFPLSDQ
jgi:hypothetical protein